ncbi:MAG: tetratricopeptide repeat protein [Thermodesulfobacteriota bacterium]
MSSVLSRIPAATLRCFPGSGLFSLCCLLFLSTPLLVLAEGYESDVMKEALKGDPQSQFALALLYEYGTENIERNPEKSVGLLTAAAKRGVSGACLYLGLKYEHGTGVKQDSAKAVCWYSCAARQGWSSAQFFLARLYELGKGVPKSTLTALAWLSLAAESGYPGAEEEFVRLQRETGFNDHGQVQSRRKQLLEESGTPCN